ncbi:hypothetical protein [Pseudonocardia sp. WMMC193]|uniref:hypothetical protein n=1 Tax=Pseudonocardia sp. WMMC193 TaxID=2911965 RepID=UPI001F230759|nr:hypothetical protein [Pseudonocardia sp. WMMC193]MCF7550951.1 hypothetical protein [Pseudonocardia sp. WMMC193]
MITEAVQHRRPWQLGAGLALAFLLAFTAGCAGSTSEEPAVDAAPTAAAPTASVGDREDAALTVQQKRDYLGALIAEVPSTQERLDRHDGDLDKAAEYVARDGLRLCDSIKSGETNEVITRQAALRFEVDEADGPAIRKVTEQYVCNVSV